MNDGTSCGSVTLDLENDKNEIDSCPVETFIPMLYLCDNTRLVWEMPLA